MNNEPPNNPLESTELHRLIEAIKTTPMDQFVLRTDNKALETLLADDPEVNLNVLTDEEKSSMTLHFIGRNHQPEFDRAVFDELKDFRPNLIIHECGADSPQHLANTELIQAASVQSLGLELTIAGKVRPTWVRASALDAKLNDMSGIDTLMREEGMKPIIRAMDLTKEEIIRRTGFEYPSRNTHAYHTKKVLEQMGASDILSAEVTPDLTDALTKDAQTIQLREEAMALDISRIIGNFRKKTANPSLRVAIVSGADHTAFLMKITTEKGLAASQSIVSDGQDDHPLDKVLHEIIATTRGRS